LAQTWHRDGDGHPDDLVQEALIRAWGHWPKLREQERFPAVVCTIARRMRFRRIRRRQPAVLQLMEIAEPCAADDEAEAVWVDVVGRWVDREWLGERLGGALAALSSVNRRLLLDYHDGFSCAELTERSGLSMDSVKTRLCRTRHRLRRELERAVRAEVAGSMSNETTQQREE